MKSITVSAGSTWVLPKSTKHKMPELVWVEWIDSMRTSTKWVNSLDVDLEAIEKQSIHYSVGFLTHETPKAIYISMSRQVDRYEDGGLEIADPLMIPKVSIIERHVINVVRYQHGQD